MLGEDSFKEKLKRGEGGDNSKQNKKHIVQEVTVVTINIRLSNKTI